MLGLWDFKESVIPLISVLRREQRLRTPCRVAIYLSKALRKR